jgi:hypothetical protein
MPPAGYEPKVSASERQQTHALDGAATGISQHANQSIFFWDIFTQIKH